MSEREDPPSESEKAANRSRLSPKTSWDKAASSDDANLKPVASSKPRKPRPVRNAFKWTLIAGLFLFLAVHLYLLLLTVLPVPTTLNMILNDDPVRRQNVPLSDISPNLVYGVIAAEDSRFCEHDGIDFEAVRKAFENNQSGGKLRGGSTISQQTAKNVIFWNGGGYLRKAGEAYVTFTIETFWSKRRIMEVYLNIADWGDGIYGAEGAARVRFRKHAADLSPREAALLAAVLPNPHEWRVDPPGPYVSGRAGTLQARMGEVRRSGYASCVIQ